MKEIKWKSTQKIQKKITESKEQKYYKVDLGIQKVEPKKIVALSRPIDDRKLERLRKSVKDDGWTDINPQTILLWKLPNGDLIVDGEGNHRAYYSRTEEVKEIKAEVSLIIDLSKLTKNQQEGVINSNCAYLIARNNYINSEGESEDKEKMDLMVEAEKERNRFLKSLSLI
ncbi:hypothetical protein [Paenibacillus terrae]|uniref:ParB/Sulfiredoxin domain-containing protein n=1 Tax=Paenibacillus terrae TaxID=159743 RepID=A0A0D7X6U9_9BACL|nr:hypothetical protein [Paenibacillus terrae]KJD47131.1 hypothetical protein QD47_02975 [Paenibacillus terrae]